MKTAIDQAFLQKSGIKGKKQKQREDEISEAGREEWKGKEDGKQDSEMKGGGCTELIRQG